jgi:hypothetical protein
MSEMSQALFDSFDEDEEVLQIAGARWKALEENPDSWVSHETGMQMPRSR